MKQKTQSFLHLRVRFITPQKYQVNPTFQLFLSQLFKKNYIRFLFLSQFFP